jgi:uncharacterized protein YjbI with pentapeptide repeats
LASAQRASTFRRSLVGDNPALIMKHLQRLEWQVPARRLECWRVGAHWRANFSGANRCGANLDEAQVLEANRGLFVLPVSFVFSGLP